MLNEKKKIMKAKIKNNDLKKSEIYTKFSNNINNFYYDLISKTNENLWWNCGSIIFQYFHLLLFTMNKNVSLLFN